MLGGFLICESDLRSTEEYRALSFHRLKYLKCQQLLGLLTALPPRWYRECLLILSVTLCWQETIGLARFHYSLDSLPCKLFT